MWLIVCVCVLTWECQVQVEMTFSFLWASEHSILYNIRWSHLAHKTLHMPLSVECLQSSVRYWLRTCSTFRKNLGSIASITVCCSTWANITLGQHWIWIFDRQVHHERILQHLPLKLIFTMLCHLILCRWGIHWTGLSNQHTGSVQDARSCS